MAFSAAEHDPRERPTLLEHALYAVDEVVGPLEVLPDVTGDGIEDVVVVRGAEHNGAKRLDLLCGASGVALRTLWRFEFDRDHLRSFAVGSDLDGDGCADLALGCIAADGAWRAKWISSRDGRVIRRLESASGSERLGESLAFVGDLDGDGVSDLAVGVVRELNDEDLASGELPPSSVHVYSGASGVELACVSGGRGEREFGAHVAALGDLDGDGEREWLVQGRESSRSPARIYSGLARAPARILDVGAGWGRCAGDLDGDDAPDLVFETLFPPGGVERAGGARCFSGRTGTALVTLPYLDWAPSETASSWPLGDLDGDGFAEIGVCEPNFHLHGPGDPGYSPLRRVPIKALSLSLALGVDSDPWCAFTHESGSARIYCGRTRKVIWGAWAPPGSREGLGYQMASVSDISGDGWRDVLVRSGDKLFAFRGPGPAPAR